MKTSDRVLVEVVIAAPIDAVWQALRDPAEIRRWFGWDYPGLTEEVDLMFVHGGRAADAEHVLHMEGMPDRFALEAIAAQTIVRLIRSAPVTDASWQGIYDDEVEGWITFVQQLRFFLERHRGDDRRTLYLNGRARAAGTPQPADALVLAGLDIAPVGERYAATTSLGDAIEGTVWFRSPYQLGLTVDGFGDGLLIAIARPKTAKSPHGGGSVVMTTYGLEDEAFARLLQRWTGWWRATYEPIEIQPAVTN